MRYYGDGPSYATSRVVPRNLTGFAPGKWQDTNKDVKGLNHLSAAADEGRIVDAAQPNTAWPNEDWSGRTHPVTAATYKPAHGGYPTHERGPEAVVIDRTGQITREIYHEQQEYAPAYFDAVRLMSALREFANKAQRNAWELEMALKDYRTMPTQAHLDNLNRVYQLLNTPDMQVSSEIEETIHIIDV